MARLQSAIGHSVLRLVWDDGVERIMDMDELANLVRSLIHNNILAIEDSKCEVFHGGEEIGVKVVPEGGILIVRVEP